MSEIKKELRKVDVSEVRPYANNPRKNDAAVDSICKSIKQCGYIAPIVVDENMEILAGHTRFKALKKLKRKTVEILVVSGLDEEQKKKYRLLDNKTSELAEWDFDLLAGELEDLDFGDLNLDWGIDEEEEKKAQEDDYEVEVPEEPKSKCGQIYLLGRHRLMCGDSTKIEDVRKLAGGGFNRLIINRSSIWGELCW